MYLKRGDQEHGVYDDTQADERKYICMCVFGTFETKSIQTPAHRYTKAT